LKKTESKENIENKAYAKREHNCKICRHIKRGEFEKQWLSKNLTLTDIAVLVGCSVVLVSRHMHDHIKENIKFEEDNKPYSNTDPDDEFQSLLRDCNDSYLKASISGDLKSMKSFMAEKRHLILARNKLQRQEKNKDKKTNAFNNPEMMVVISSLLKTLEKHPEAREDCINVLVESGGLEASKL